MEPTKPDSGATPIETAGGAAIPKVEVLKPEDTLIQSVGETPDAHAGIERIAQEKSDLGLDTAGPPTDNLDSRRQALQHQSEKEALGTSNDDLSVVEQASIDTEKTDLGINEPIPPVTPTEPAGGAPVEPPKTGPSSTPEVRDELQTAINRAKFLETATDEQIKAENPTITTPEGIAAFRTAGKAESQAIIDKANAGPEPRDKDELQLATNRAKFLETATDEQIKAENPTITTPEGIAAFRKAALVEQREIITRNGGTLGTAEGGAPGAEANDPDKQKKIADYEAQINDKSITPEGYAEYKKLTEDPTKRQAELEEKVRNKTATEAEFNEWKNGPEPEDVETRSLEEIAAENQEKLDQLGLKATELFAADKNPAEAIIALKKEEAAQRGITLSKEDEAITREFYKGIYDADGNAPYRETARARAIKEKFKELGQMEMMIINYAEIVQKQKDQEDKMKEDTNRAEDDYLREQEPAQRIKKLNEWNLKARALERLQASTRGIKQRGRDMVEKQREVAGWIHRKLGTKKWYQNLGYGFHSTLIGAKHNLQRPGDIVDIFA